MLNKNTTYNQEKLLSIIKDNKLKGYHYPYIAVLDDGVYLLKDESIDDQQIITKHFICNRIEITDAFNDIESHSKTYVLTFLNHQGNIEKITVAAEIISDKNKVVALSKFGVDVNTSNASNVILHLNNEMRKIPTTKVTEFAGIKMLNNRWCYLGRNCFYYDSTKKRIMRLKYRYNGDLNLSSSGSWADYKSMLNDDVLSSVEMSTALALGASSLLIGYIGASIGINNLFIHISGESSSGKSTALELALSLFGNTISSTSETRSLFTTWNATENAIQEFLTNNFGIPIGIDEAGMSKSHEFSSLIYRIAEGKEKGRMNYGVGNAVIRTWNTTVISTGEILLQDKT